jgi:hypothetical protein
VLARLTLYDLSRVSPALFVLDIFLSWGFANFNLSWL